MYTCARTQSAVQSNDMCPFNAIMHFLSFYQSDRTPVVIIPMLSEFKLVS